MAKRKKSDDNAPPRAFAEAPQAAFLASDAPKPEFGVANRLRLTLGPGGRVVIPAALREAMEIEEGDAILAWVEDGELHLLSPRVGARQAQAMLKALMPESGSLAGELIAERRREAEAESRA